MSLPVHLGAVAGRRRRRRRRSTVDGDEAHHAVAVRRLRVGEQVVLTDGAGTSATCTVDRDRQAPLSRRGRVERARRPSRTPRVTVVQAIPKGDRGELAVEVLTEVGVDRIVPWAAARSVAVWRGERAGEVAGQVARHRPRGRQAGAPVVVPRGRRAGDDRRRGRRWSRTPTSPWCCTRRRRCRWPTLRGAGRGRDRRRGRPRGRAHRRRSSRRSSAPAPTPVRLGAEVLRTSTAGVAAVAALLARTPRWS